MTDTNQRNRFSLKSLNFQNPEPNYLNSSSSVSKNVFTNKLKKPQLLQQGNSTLFELNQRYFLEAESCFKRLKIENNMSLWMNNCQRWLFKQVLYQFLQENAENVFDLNNELTSYFGKYLYEIQLFDTTAANNIRNNRYTRVTIDDLMSNQEMLKKNQNTLNPFTSNFHEINKINEKMKNCESKIL